MELKHYINGAFVAGGGTPFTTTNPATGDPLATVHTATAADIDAAVTAAQQAQPHWAAKSGLERGRILSRIATLLRENNDRLAEWESRDTGKPITESRTVDIHWAADCFEYYAGVAPTLNGDHLPTESGFFYTRREPLGVTAGIGAWNYPLQVAAWKIAPALACGNAMLFKPAELTPITATLFADIATQAGLPRGIFNVVHGDGATGALLSRHPGIAKISLTGETGTGKQVMADAAATLKHITMELGGKSPLLVFPDADLDGAVSAAMAGNFFTQGEVCTHCTRVFLHRDIKTAFTRQLLARTRALKTGDPMAADTQIGTLISRDHQQRVLNYIAQGKAAGATLLAGGAAPTDPALTAGAFVLPTVFDDCTDDMTLVQEEIFGPVMTLLEFADEQEAVTRANATHYGLAAGLFTRDLTRAHRVAAALQAGMCWINNYGIYNMHMPAGGFKQSGIGTENGLDTLRHYTHPKTVYVELGPVTPAF